MKLLNKTLLKQLPQCGNEKGEGDDMIAYAKFADPCGSPREINQTYRASVGDVVPHSSADGGKPDLL
jgi:hypothetical protein